MKVSESVLAVLSQCETNGHKLFLVDQLDRAMYQAVNKVIEAAGGKWNRKEKAHIFDGDAASRIDQIILTGDVDIPKDEFEYFPTSAPVVGRMITVADIKAGMIVKEPSAGQAAIAEPVRACGCEVHTVELNPANASILREKGFSVTEGDFLGIEPSPIYDRVLMNPPFRNQADIKHVKHALKFLKEDGRLVAIMSAGVKFRENKLTKDFRETVLNAGGSIEDLPDNSFKHAGTLVKTVIVTIPAHA